MITRVNGEPIEVVEGDTITDLLRRLDAPLDGVAVAVDGAVVPRAEHSRTLLRPGQQVEVIRAVGGG